MFLNSNPRGRHLRLRASSHFFSQLGEVRFRVDCKFFSIVSRATRFLCLSAKTESFLILELPTSEARNSPSSLKRKNRKAFFYGNDNLHNFDSNFYLYIFYKKNKIKSFKSPRMHCFVSTKCLNKK